MKLLHSCTVCTIIFIANWMFHVRCVIETTWLSLQATGDPYYLRVGQSIVEKLNAYARVPCGFAAVQDVRTGTHEDRYTDAVTNLFTMTCFIWKCDIRRFFLVKPSCWYINCRNGTKYLSISVCVCRMDSFFLAEMFKYLYLLFSEKSQLPIDVDDYIFTTEAHLLPVSLSTTQPPCQSNNTVRALTHIFWVSHWNKLILCWYEMITRQCSWWHHCNLYLLLLLLIYSVYYCVRIGHNDILCV